MRSLLRHDGLRFGTSVLAAVTAVAVGLAVGTPTAVADPTGGVAGQSWTATTDGPNQYPGIAVQEDVPIRMSDGVVLRASVYRPADASGAAIDAKLPTIFNITPYTRLVPALADAASTHPVLGQALDQLGAADLSGTPFDGITELTGGLGGGLLRTFGVNRNLVQNGYVQVVVDVRGTGYSEGAWDVLGDREQQDTVEVFDWARSQPWSDGALGMAGVSYSAINSLHAADKRPQGLKAIFPVEPSEDLAREIVATGGAFGAGFMPAWLVAVNGLKFVPIDSLLRGDFDPQWLADRLADPAVMFPQMFDAVLDVRGEAANDGPFYDVRNADVERIQVPTFVTGGWHDIFGRGEPRIFDRLQLPAGQKQLLMGNGYHINPGLGHGKEGAPPRLDVLERAWFDKWIKGIDNGIDRYGPATLYQQGGGWITASQYPRAGAEYQRLYLNGTPSGSAPHAVVDGSLATAAPIAPSTHSVAPGLRAACSRDSAQGTAGFGAILGSACTEDARFAEAEALTFTTAPVTEDTEISGPIAVHLLTTTDAPEGFWSVTVNDVAPDGRSTVLTNGALLSSRGALDESKSEKDSSGDYTVPVADLGADTKRVVTPGVPLVLDVGLGGTEAKLAPGHRLRVDISAASFPRYLPMLPDLQATALKPQRLLIDPANPSFVNVPVVGSVGW
ncbi:putative CocE/NonD family hydrolase [Rhodococcus sp. LBL1]|nr:putative CocE/NonD family hydrolase [Rhodococcus sp. LBL1]MDH6683274.1 putative CocE/NonD family hydrolase [Rhodococcus sp. LBL2]